MFRGTGFPFGTRPRYFSTSCCACSRLEIPDEHRRRVVRHVVRRVELAHLPDRRRLEIAEAANRRVLVRVSRERAVEDDFGELAERLVLHLHPPLFLDDLDLGLQLLRAHFERGHAVGLEPERERQVVRGHRLPVDRRVFVGLGVRLATDARDQ